MACDWVARMKFRILYLENGVIKELIITDERIIAVWFSQCYCSVQEEIDEWERRSPDAIIYKHGQWCDEDANGVIFSTAVWGGFKQGNISHIYTKQQIIRLLGMDLTAITEITAIPFGVQYY
jgi:hypothetical protein